MEISPIHAVTPGISERVSYDDEEQADTHRRLVRAVNGLRRSELFGSNNDITFGTDPGTHRRVIKIVNRQTGEIVHQLPPEYVLRLAAEDAVSLSNGSG